MKKYFRNPYFCIKFFIILSATLYLISVAIALFLKIDEIEISDDSFNLESKCPLCYGQSLCKNLKKFKSFTLESKTFSDDTYLYNRFINIKNVYLAKYNFAQTVIIKKLAHNDELKLFDSFEKSCVTKDNSPKCISKILHSKYKFVTPHTFSPNMMDIEFGACISDRLIDLMYKSYKEYENNERRITDMNILTTLKINPEPILLQMFPESDGWPFPKYFGACGRMIVEAHKGDTLDKYINEPFKFRAKIALKFLEALQMLTENDLQVSIFLTDLGYENISYDQETQKVFFIDTENSIIVDKDKIIEENPKDWNSTYYIATFDDCEKYGNHFGTCLTYDVQMMCNSYHADFNFYSACRNLLSSYATDPRIRTNFLHSIPENIDEKYNLDNLLDACAKNEYNYGIGRFEVVGKILKILRTISSDDKL